MTVTTGRDTAPASAVSRREARSARSRLRRGARRQALPYIALLLPAAVLLAGLLLYPIVSSVLTSFTAANTHHFVGLDNYRRFFHDPQNTAIIGHTFIRGVGGVVPSYLIGLVAAVALHQRIRARTTLRVLVLVPFVISAPVGLNMWRLLLDPQTGVPVALGWHIGDLFANQSLVWPTLLAINAWASFQFYTIILLAALGRVPEELYEAAHSDGAGRWQRFRYVTMPGIAAVSGFAAIVHFMASFQEFNLVYITTGGGPLNATQTLATFAYARAFSDYDSGYATTITTISMLVMMATLGVGFALVKAIVPAVRKLRRTGLWPHLPERRRRPAAPRVRQPRRSGAGRRDNPVLPYVGTVVVLLVSVLPILFILSRALDATPGGTQAVALIPRHWSLSNFQKVLSDPALWSTNNLVVPPLAMNFVYSIAVALATTVLVLVVGMLGGYALSRWRSRWTRAFLAVLVLLQLVPVIVLVFPLYDLLSRIHLLGSLAGLVLATSTIFLPLCTLLFKVFFDGIPRDIEESAAIDGAGTLRIFTQIVRPLSRPVMGAVAAYTLINTWNEYLLATTLISDPNKRTFPAALQQYMSSFSFKAQTTPGMQAVYLLIPIAAAIVLLALTQRHLSTAYQGGSLKG